MPPFPPPRWVCLSAAALLALAGCERDEIRSYTARRAAPDAGEAKVRLVAAVFENNGRQWYFKLLGPVDQVSKHAEDFARFLASLRFSDKPGEPVAWEVPAGWKKGPPAPLRYASFVLGPRGQAPEVTVSDLDKVSPLLANVNRWCRLNLGRPPLGEADLAAATKDIRAGDKAGVLVDLTGPGVRGKGVPRADQIDMHGRDRRPGPLPITYTVPPGWEETGPRASMGIVVLTAFQVRQGGESAEATVLALGAMPGGPLGNVNRWRGQVGLPEITQAQLDKDPPAGITAGGRKAPYYDFKGAARRMLLVTVPRGNKTWYFKLLGSAGVVGKNKAAFESFVQSVQFTGAADE
jgi:hypothetical protein